MAKKEIKVEIDEEKVECLFKEALVKEMICNVRFSWVSKALEKPIREVIYENKDKIIDMVIERATAEIVRRAKMKTKNTIEID